MKALDPEIDSDASARPRSRSLFNSQSVAKVTAIQKFSQLIASPPEILSKSEKSFVFESASFSHLKNEIRPLVENQHKSNKEAKELYEIVKDLKTFNEITGNLKNIDNVSGMMHLCRNLKYCSFPMGATVIKQNESNDGRLYIVMAGELHMNVRAQGMKTMIESDRRIIGQHGGSTFSNEMSGIRRCSIINNGSMRSGSPVRNESPFRYESISRIDLQSMNASQNHQSSNRLKRGTAIFFSNTNPSLKRKDSKVGLARFKNSSMTAKLHLDLQAYDENLEGMGTTKESSVVEMDSKNRILDSNDESMISSSPNSKLVGRIEEGGFFGARWSFKTTYRSAAVIAESDVELLYLEKAALEQLQHDINRSKIQKLRFLNEQFGTPAHEYNDIIMDRILNIVDIRTYNYQQIITNEGDVAEEFFCVYEGAFELVKTFIYDKSGNLDAAMSDVKGFYGLNKTIQNKVTLSNLERGSIFGEEALFSEHGMYEYTVRVCSERAKVFSFNKSEFQSIASPETFTKLKQAIVEKYIRNLKSINEKLLSKDVVFTLENLKVPKPVILAPKTLTSYDPSAHQIQLSRRKSITKLESKRISPLKSQTLIIQAGAAEDGQDSVDITDFDLANSVILSSKPRKNLSKDANTCKSFMHVNMAHVHRLNVPRSSENSPGHYMNISFTSSDQASANIDKLKPKVPSSFKSPAKVQDITTTDITDIKFDFGRKDAERSSNTRKPRRPMIDPPHNVNTPTKPSKNFELSNLITLKLKELGRVDDINAKFRILGNSKDNSMSDSKMNLNHTDQLYSLDNSVNLFHAKSKASLMVLDFSKVSTGSLNNSGCPSPDEANVSPRANFTPLKGHKKANNMNINHRLSKIAAAVNEKNDSDSLPSISSIRKAYHKRSVSEQKSKFYGRPEL